ncbi:MAG: oligosaccharide repeat unit polymerase, partial [Aquincola sp.]|nr:oligosaccharide repeat unit polymerase [Aquincola sp.]
DDLGLGVGVEITDRRIAVGHRQLPDDRAVVAVERVAGDHLLAAVPHDARSRLPTIEIALDCANGAAYKVAPEVLWELGADVKKIGVEPNGFNINQDCGSTSTKALQKAVLDYRADLGVALDGDADRVVLVDEKGREIQGDQLLALIARFLQSRGKLTGGAVVSTVMANFGLEKYLGGLGLKLAAPLRRPLNHQAPRVRLSLWLAAGSCSMLLTIALAQSGALSMEFIEYFAMLRLAGENVEGLTGSRALDVLTKIYAFPMSYAVLVVSLASNPSRLRLIIIVCIANFAMFAYLWQVNYPLIHLFWFLVFFSVLQARRGGGYDIRVGAFIAIVMAALVVSAVNRFDGDLVGAVQRYIFGYHLVGFSFYDQQFSDPHSILHEHTFGRSSLGFLEQMAEALARALDLRYRAASSENATFTNEALEIGRTEWLEFNAFGTFLFTFVRDFSLLGVLLGGFIYGAAATYALRGGRDNWACGSLFFLLSAAWMMGMMVSPLEQAYFWFCIAAIGVLTLVNRGLRWR